MELAMTWEKAALDAEFRSAVFKKEFLYLKRQSNIFANVAKTCWQKVNQNEKWPIDK